MTHKNVFSPSHGALTHNELKKLVVDQLKIDPLYPDTVRENGLDLRIGGEYAIYAYLS